MAEFRPLTDTEIQHLQEQGYDLSDYKKGTPVEVEGSLGDTTQQSSASDLGKLSTAQAIGATTKAHAGAYAGGGAGALSGMALGAMVPPPFDVVTIPAGGIIGGLAGSYSGQKAQEKLLPKDLEESLQARASLAAQQHPIASAATDITAAALTSGGSLSPMTAIKAARQVVPALLGKGVGTELAQTAIAGTVNPAINAGLNYAETGELPSFKDTAMSALGGAAFAKPSWLGRWAFGRQNGNQRVEGTDNVASPIEDIDRLSVANTIPEANVFNDVSSTSSGLRPQQQREYNTPTEDALSKYKGSKAIPEEQLGAMESEGGKPIVEDVTTSKNIVIPEIVKQIELPTEEARPVETSTETKSPNYAPAELSQHLESGKATTDSALELLGNSSHELAPLAKALRHIADKDSLAVKWETSGIEDKNVRSAYYPSTDVVKLSSFDTIHAPTIMEEAIHSLTSRKLPRQLSENRGSAHLKALQDYVKFGDNLAVKDLIGAYMDTAKHLGIESELFADVPVHYNTSTKSSGVRRGLGGNPDLLHASGLPYEMGTLDEFIAGAMKNPKFQTTLEGIKTVDGRTMWQRVVDTVRKILGLSPKANSMLDRVLRSTADLTAQERNPIIDKTYTDNLASSEKFAAPKKEDDLAYKKASFVPLLTGRIDKVAETLKTPEAQMVTNELHKFAGEADYLGGKIGNKLIAATKGFTPEQIDKVHHYLHQVDNTGSSSLPMTARERALASQLTEIIREPRKEQIKMGLFVKGGSGLREAGIKPEGYVFNILSPKVAHEWANNPNSEKSLQYDKSYINHLLSKNTPLHEAKQALHEYKNALGNNVAPDIEYGAVRKAEGAGLPWDLVEQNFAAASSRYARRTARDFAYFKYIQSNPKMLKALNLRDQFGHLPSDADVPDVQSIATVPAVQKALRSVYGLSDIPLNPTITAAARVVNNSVMGIGTAARNIATMPAFIAQYVQVPQLPIVFKALAGLNESKVRAFESNAVKASFQDFDAAGFYEGNPNPVINLANKFSQFLRKYQGRDFSDKFEGELYYSLGEQLTVDNIARARLGNKESLRFVKRFGDIVDGGAESLLNRPVTQEDISRVSKRFVDAARGTYTEEGLPSWALEGPLAPFFMISRFSIEKANTIWKDVVMPMKEGIYGPMLRYSLGSVLTGVAIEKINELFSNKRGADPTISEVLDIGKPDDYLAKMIGLLQLSSYAGSVSDAAKLAMNAYKGKSLEYSNPISFPLYSFVTDTLAKNISDAAQAVHEGEDPVDTMASLVTAIAGQSVQSLRYYEANFGDPETAKHKEKFRDLRAFNELNDTPSPQITGQPNRFADTKSKEFKRTSDIQEAISLLPDLLKKAMDDSKGNPEIFDQKLRGLKANSYQVMPSMDTMPKKAMDYLQFLSDTQGQKASSTLLQDYLQQSAINKMKSSVVP